MQDGNRKKNLNQHTMNAHITNIIDSQKSYKIVSFKEFYATHTAVLIFIANHFSRVQEENGTD